MDIQQELVLKLMDFQFDPEKSNGAQESTVLQVFIDNELKMRHRSQQRRKNHTEALRWITELSENPSKSHLAIDIKNALLSLPLKQRQICIALAEGYAVIEIADLLKIYRGTVYRHIRKIRRHFQSLGLDQWMDR
jgi:RNA polymerase sigma factor (sigma-70 family)